MKKCNKIFGAFLICLIIMSCEDIIDREPADAITESNYWNNVDNLKLFANDFYTLLNTPDHSADVQSDNAVPNSPNDWLQGNETVPSSGGGWSASDWGKIRDANSFLAHFREVEDPKEEKNHYLGEIYFFRAYDYFQKVKRFGDVPWINKELELSDEEYLNMERTPRKEVVDSILDDLDLAIGYLEEPEKVEDGRVHKFAALQFQARVALYEGTWLKYRNKDDWEKYIETAVKSAKRIIDEGGYEVEKTNAQYFFEEHELIDGGTGTYSEKDYPLYYKSLFIQEDLSGSPEAILVKRFDKNLLPHSISRMVNESGIGVSKDFIESFLCVDGKPIALSDHYKGDNSIKVEFENRDPRLRNMIDNRFLPSFLDDASLVSNFLTPINSQSPTGYRSFKYRTPVPEQNEANQGSTDLFIFRYAEVLLIYAEGKAELGTITQEDIDKSINRLRARLDEPTLPNGKMARLSIDPPSDPNANTIKGEAKYGYEISPLIYEIRRERRIELAFEGFRWDDIVRWKAGKLIENPKSFLGLQVNLEVVAQYDNYFDSDVFGGRKFLKINDWDESSKELLSPYGESYSRKWNDKLYLHPLPKDQLNLNENLEQNPGWD